MRPNASRFLAALILAGSPHTVSLPAQAPKTTGPATYRIAGRIVSSLDARPLQHATLTLLAIGTDRTVASTLTNDTGQFAFDHLAPGKYSLRGDTPGYIDAAYDEHESFSTAIVTGAAVDTESLILRLTPFANLSGRITDEAGEPIRQARVTLLRERHGTGQTQIGPAQTVQTDDRGDYVMAPLRDGRVFLSVQATPWYATHPQPARSGMGNPILTGVDPTLDVAYLLTFYPGVTDPDAATPIDIKGGEELHLDLHLAPVHAARLTIHTVPGEQKVGYPQLRIPTLGGFENVMGQMQTVGTDTEIVGLPPGKYLVDQTDPRTGAPIHSHAVDLSTGTAEIGAFKAEAGATVKVLVQDESGAALPPHLQVSLRGSEPSILRATLDEKGEGTFPGVVPGEYRLLVYGGGRPNHVVRIEAAGKRLPQDRLRLAAGESAEVKVVIATTTASIEGVALSQGKPAPGAMIVLVPVDAVDEPELFRRDQSDLDGTFTLHNVRAGRYIVLAIDNGWQLEWGKPQVLARYLPYGIPIEVPSATSRPVHLPDPLSVQTR